MSSIWPGAPELRIAPASEWGASLSNLLDQVEAKVFRAKRAFRRSTYIITAARDELESHQRWLDRHRAAWAEQVKRYHRLLDRKISLRPFTRFVGLILSVPCGLAQALRLKKRPPHPSSQLSLSETTSDYARHSQLQHRIRGLDGQLCTMKPPVPRPISEQIATRGECPLIADGGAFRAVAAHGRFLKSKGVLSALGLTIVFLIAAVAFRATTYSPPADAPVSFIDALGTEWQFPQEGCRAADGKPRGVARFPTLGRHKWGRLHRG